MEFLIPILMAIGLALLSYADVHRNILFRYLFHFWALANLLLTNFYTLQNFNFILILTNMLFLIFYIFLLILVSVFKVFESLKEKYEKALSE